MNNILTISKFTIREALSRKIFVTFFAISTFVILVFAALFAFVSFEDLIQVSTANDPTMSIDSELVKGLKLFVVAPLFGGGLFLAIFSAASFIPNMLEKGSIDLLLSKPISRAQVILGKFLGGTIIVFVNIAYLIISIWLLIGIKFGIWELSFLLTILTITFTFAVLYSLIILIGILTQSSVLAMMISYLIFFILSPILNARDTISTFIDNSAIETILNIFHYITPKTSELGSITTTISLGGSIDSFQPILTSFLFMVIILYLSISIFRKKDY
ncbi:MAG: ABC transporter permease subunit [Ignavibacteriae bacterium]|nr:ABC transporter permease subunit [Ignavibacteriota bacterium]